MLGTVYGGDFYTVIDTKMPWDRIRKIFSVLKPAAIITDRDHEETVREALASERKDSPKILLYEKAMYVPEDREGLAKIRRKAVDTDLVYTLFTSGSTGMPKGVAVSHRNVMAYAEWVKTTFDINEATVFGSQTPFLFQYVGAGYLYNSGSRRRTSDSAEAIICFSGASVGVYEQSKSEYHLLGADGFVHSG